MEGGWKWKHINRSTILYKLLHKIDKLLKKKESSLVRLGVVAGVLEGEQVQSRDIVLGATGVEGG